MYLYLHRDFWQCMDTLRDKMYLKIMENKTKVENLEKKKKVFNNWPNFHIQ